MMPSRDVAGFSTEEISRHIQRTVGPISTVFHEIVSDDLHIDLHHVRSTFLRRFEVVVTSGMSARAMNVPPESRELAYAELIAILPSGWPMQQTQWSDERNYWPLRLLKTLARFPHERGTYLAHGHSLGNGVEEYGAQPYADDTGLCAALLLPPLTLGERTWVLRRPDGTQCCFWAVVPLYAAELRYKMQHGIEALMACFDRASVFDRIDPHRASAV